MEGRRKEGRTDGLLARDVRGAAAETAGEDRAKASGRGGRRRTEPPPPTPETRAGYHTVVRPPRRGDGPRRTSSRRTTGPNEPPDAPRPGRIERQRDDGRPLKASFLRKDRHGRYLPARTGPQRTRRAGHEARGAVATSNCSPACRAAPGPRRTPGRARARPSPQTGGPAARPGRPTGENRRQAGRGNGTAEREPAAAGATGTAPGRRPTRDRERPPIRATTGQRELTDGNHTAPRLLLRQSRRQTSGAKPARNRRRPPGSPGRPNTRDYQRRRHRRRPPSGKWGPGTRPATRRARPTVVPQRPHPREKSVSPATPGTPWPRGGEGHR